MKIPIYDIFGDNYIRQVAIEADNFNILWNAIEIEDDSLRNVLDIAAKIAKIKEEKSNKLILPLSGNDKKIWEKVLKCYNFTSTALLSDVLSNFSMKPESCKLDNVPSFVKPEFYEYIKMPGLPGKEKFKITVDGLYIIIAAAGWVLTRLGKVKINEKDWLGVQTLTFTKSNLYKIFENIYVPGIKPEVAFAIWIGKNIIDANLNVYGLKVFLISDAVGQAPTAIVGGFLIDLQKLLENKELLNDDIVWLAKDALNIDSNTRNYSTKIVTLAYEVLSGSKKIEDLLYYANRDLIMNSNTNDANLKWRLKIASRYANYLYSKMI